MALPAELQQAIIDQLVATNCPLITLRSPKDLDNVVSQLIDDTAVVDRESDSVWRMVIDAIWRISVIRPDVVLRWETLDDLGASRTVFQFAVEEDEKLEIGTLARKVRHLELALDIEVVAPVAMELSFTSAELIRAATSMDSLQTLFPNVKNLILYIPIGLHRVGELLARSSRWWSFPASSSMCPEATWGKANGWTREATSSEMEALDDFGMTIRNSVIHLMEAAKRHWPDTKLSLKLLLERGMNWRDIKEGRIAKVRPAGCKPWLRRCAEIEFTDAVDLNEVFVNAWTSRQECSLPDALEITGMPGTRRETSLCHNAWGSYAE